MSAQLNPVLDAAKATQNAHQGALGQSVVALKGYKPSQNVISSIHKASARTGVDFTYLVEQAAAESSFNAKAKASTSSAAGLYQFIEKTWLTMVKNHGHKYGMGDWAQAIDKNGNVSDPALKKIILDARFDPQKASVMAAEFAAENERFLQTHWNGAKTKEIGSTELYLAHFLGAGQAASFLNARDAEPHKAAAYAFPKAAAANKNVFYDPESGRARSFEEVYAFFDGKFTGEEIKPQLATDNAAKSYQTPYTRDLHTLELSQSQNLVRHMMHSRLQEALLKDFSGQENSNENSRLQKWSRSGTGKTAHSYNPLSSYQAMVSNPVEILLLSQLDTNLGLKNKEI